MYKLAYLTIRNYIPQDSQKTLWFMDSRFGVPFIFEKKFPTVKMVDDYVQENGFPVHIAIICVGDPNLMDVQELAPHNAIGWLDQDDDNDDLTSVSIDDINRIFSDFDGMLEIAMEEEDETPVRIEDKVVIRFLNTYGNDDDPYDDFSSDSREILYEEQEDICPITTEDPDLSEVQDSDAKEPSGV